MAKAQRSTLPRKRAAASEKGKAGRSAPHPNFKPEWSMDEAISCADAGLAPDHITAVAFRLVSVLLSKTPDELMAMALADGEREDGPTMTALKLLDEAKGHFEGRLEMLNAARTRVLWSAAYVNGL